MNKIPICASIDDEVYLWIRESRFLSARSMSQEVNHWLNYAKALYTEEMKKAALDKKEPKKEMVGDNLLV
ncbi:MAG: hypothetical protein KJO12_10195 [Ignavibacteria bacterium]|nr:hypothetical protein [Ignavibacteria bacterium]